MEAHAHEYPCHMEVHVPELHSLEYPCRMSVHAHEYPCRMEVCGVTWQCDMLLYLFVVLFCAVPPTNLNLCGDALPPVLHHDVSSRAVLLRTTFTDPAPSPTQQLHPPTQQLHPPTQPINPRTLLSSHIVSAEHRPDLNLPSSAQLTTCAPLAFAQNLWRSSQAHHTYSTWIIVAPEVGSSTDSARGFRTASAHAVVVAAAGVRPTASSRAAPFGLRQRAFKAAATQLHPLSWV
eukprot:355619-Chlamydomonas_euryale.AAC.7